jgi:hypothetical protein
MNWKGCLGIQRLSGGRQRAWSGLKACFQHENYKKENIDDETSKVLNYAKSGNSVSGKL